MRMMLVLNGLNNLSDVSLFSIGSVIAIVLAQLVLTFYRLYRDRGMGLLLFAFVRDLQKLVKCKLQNEWRDLPLSKKLDRLRSLYDIIDSLEDSLSEVDLDDVNSEDLKVLQSEVGKI